MTRLSLFLATLSLLAAAHGCVGTPGRAITGTLELELLDLDEPTSTGWTVDVERAALVVSAVRVRDEAYPSAVAMLQSLLSPRAFAHGGHGEPDVTVLASWVGAEVLLLGDATPSLPLEGHFGVTDRGALVLGGALDDADPRAAMLHAMPLWVEGTASRGEAAVRFAGGFALEERESERLVEGIPMAGPIDDDVVVHIGLDVGLWFDAVHFDRLTPDDDGVAPIAAGTQAAIAMRLGLGELDGYVATVTSSAVP